MTSPKKGQNWVMCNTPSSSSTDITLPPAICQKELVITYVESPCTFWGTLASQLGKQLDIENKLSSLCDSLPRVKNTLKPGKMYACKYSYDGLWYRCRIYQFISKTQVEVLYVDYGNREVVSNMSLVELPPDVADLHVLAYPYWLLRVKNIETSDAVEKGIEIMEDLKNSTNLNATLYSKTKEGIIPVTVVLDSGEDLSELMVDRGICVFMTDDEMRIKFNASIIEAGSKHGMYRAEKTKSVLSAGASHLSAGVGMNTAYSKERAMGAGMKTSRNAASSPVVDTSSISPSSLNMAKTSPRAKSRSPVKLVKLKSMSVRNDGQMDYITQNMKGEEGDGRQGGQLTHKKNIEYGIEQLSCELTESTNDVLCLQLANNNLKQDLEECKSQLKALEEIANNKDTLTSSKMKNMLLEAKKVSRLRKRLQKQNELKFELDKVGDILISVQPSNPMLRKIASVQAVFDNLQRKIKAKNLIDDELAKLISARDSARKLLYDDLEEFLVKVSQYPLEEAFNKVKEILLALSIKPDQLKELERGVISGGEGLGDDASSSAELPEDKFQTALLTYRAWRMSGLKDHRFIQIKMDDKKQQITLALNYVIKVMTEEDAEVLKEDSALANLDEIIDEFKQAAHEESLSMMKELGELDGNVELPSGGGEGNSKSKMGSILWVSIEGLLLEVRKVIEVINKYRSLMQELGTWLHCVPDVSDLKNIIRNIRCYKSQLRHLLADHADLEEEKLVKGSMMERDNRIGLLTKLDHTRNILQERLELENQILVRMLESDLKQFPELVLYHPDIPFKNILSFSPIVKHGRSLDQYTLESLDDESNAYKSTYLGRVVTLKECHLRGMSCEQFETLVNQYVATCENHLAQTIDFIFFDMKKLTAIIQSSFRELTLGKMLSQGSDEKMLLYILFNILSSLNDMHRKGIIHGSVSPSYIFYDSDTWTAFLRPPDFSFTPFERAKDNTWRNWRYVPPEVCQGACHISPSVDMYTFGILLYQICKPSNPIDMHNDINSIFAKEPPSCRIEMIKLLLNPKPEERPSAETLLKTQYWLDIARDYEKGKSYLIKQQHTAQEDKALNFQVPELIRGDRRMIDKKKIRQKIAEMEYPCDAYSQDDSEDDNSSLSEEKYVKERKRSSKVKFAMEGDDFDKSEDDDDVTALNMLNGMSPDKHSKDRPKASGGRTGKSKHVKGSMTGDDDYVSSDLNTEGSGSRQDGTVDTTESLSETSTLSGEEASPLKITFAQTLPSLEQRISGINRHLNVSKRVKCASSDEDNADD